MDLHEKKRALIERLAAIEDGQERFARVVQEGRLRPPLADQFRTDQFRVEGCLANLWFVPEHREGRCFFSADSDSLIVRGIAGLLCDFYSGHRPDEILRVDPSFLAEVGITQHLSPNRLSGLSRLWEQIRGFAARCL